MYRRLIGKFSDVNIVTRVCTKTYNAHEVSVASEVLSNIIQMFVIYDLLNTVWKQNLEVKTQLSTTILGEKSGKKFRSIKVLVFEKNVY